MDDTQDNIEFNNVNNHSTDNVTNKNNTYPNHTIDDSKVHLGLLKYNEFKNELRNVKKKLN